MPGTVPRALFISAAASLGRQGLVYPSRWSVQREVHAIWSRSLSGGREARTCPGQRGLGAERRGGALRKSWVRLLSQAGRREVLQVGGPGLGPPPTGPPCQLSEGQTAGRKWCPPAQLERQVVTPSQGTQSLPLSPPSRSSQGLWRRKAGDQQPSWRRGELRGRAGRGGRGAGGSWLAPLTSWK